MSSVGFDFDGVIHTYEKGWDDGTIYGDHVEGIFELIAEIQQHHAVFIYSVRDSVQIAYWLCFQHKGLRTVTENGNRSGFSTVWEWDEGLMDNRPGVRGHEEYLGTVKFWNDHERIFVTDRKLPAMAYVDDRAVRFINPFQTRSELHDRGIITVEAWKNTR